MYLEVFTLKPFRVPALDGTAARALSFLEKGRKQKAEMLRYAHISA